MKVKTDKGFTECHIETFAALDPAVLKVREAYRKACQENPTKKDDHDTKVRNWCAARFGVNRFNRDYDHVNPPVMTPTGVSHGGGDAIKKWDEFISSKPPEYRAWYISAEVVAECIMGKDE
jgi:hypothetical protein